MKEQKNKKYNTNETVSKTRQSKVKHTSIRFKIMNMSLIAILVVVLSICILTLPNVLKLQSNSITVHMNDFITAHSKQIMNEIESMQQTMDNIALTSTSTMGTTNALDPYIQITRQMKSYAKQNQMENDYVVMVDDKQQIVASSKDSYVGLKIDDELYNKANATGDETKLTTILDDKTGEIKLLISTRLLLEEKEVEIETEETNTEDTNQNKDDEELKETEKETKIVRTEVMFYYYVSNETIQNELLDYTLNGIPEPVLTIIDNTGTVIACSNDEAIGNKTTNTVLKDLISKRQNGRSIDTQARYKKFHLDDTAVGVSYIHMPETDWFISVSAKDKEVFSDVYAVLRNFITSVLISIAVVVIIIFFMSRYFSKPIEKVNRVIRRVSELDFTWNSEDVVLKKIMCRNDEIGDIAHSVIRMVTVVKDKLSIVNEASEQISEATTNLHSISNDISNKANDTSAITEELSAGMEEATASTQVIADDIIQLKDNVIIIKNQISEGAKYSEEMIQRADLYIKESKKSENSTRAIFSDIKEKGEIALKQSEAVKQIDEFAQVIKSIADQTNLLSLNASIEAARAGEAGRGFAVVATEIGSLAQQSADTVQKISEMVFAVNEAVHNIIECLNTSQEFVETNVYNDYNAMQNILAKFAHDINNIHLSMEEIDTNAQSVEKTTINITESIEAINQTAQEAAIGVSDIAARNSDIGSLTSDTYKMVYNVEELVKELNHSMDAFKL